MFRKSLLILAVLSFAGLFLSANDVQAQRGRGGRVNPGPAYRPAYRPAPRPAYNYNPGYRYSSPAYRYSYPAYRYSYPVYPYRSTWVGSNYVYPNHSYYYPAPVYTVPPVTTTLATADIRVIVPDPQATVYFDGLPTTTLGTDRLYHTSALTYGVTYTYRIRATWLQAGQQVTQERIVNVRAGQTTVVDFTQ